MALKLGLKHQTTTIIYKMTWVDLDILYGKGHKRENKKKIKLRGQFGKFRL